MALALVYRYMYGPSLGIQVHVWPLALVYRYMYGP